jgi:tetratricopeptide (TPR) repeat protein
MTSPMLSATVFLLCLIADSAHAQETNLVEGTVLSNQGLPAGTTVNLRLETLDGSLVESGTADTRGQFKFMSVPEGYYKLTVTAEGYLTTQQPLVLRRGGGRSMVNVMLAPMAQARSGDGSDAVSVTDLSAPKKARKALEKGERQFAEEKLKEAQASFERALAEHPCYARALTRLGMTLELKGEFAPAETALRKAIECDAAFLEAHTQLGILLNHMKRFEDSRTALTSSVERFPASWQLHYQLAAAEYGVGDYEEAEQQYLKAKSIGKDVSPEICVRLADVYTQLQEHDKAYAELREYLRADPNGRFAKKVNEIIERMENDGVVEPLKPAEAPAEP